MFSKNASVSSCDIEYNLVVALPRLTKDEIQSWKKKSNSQNTEVPCIKIEPQELDQDDEETVEIMTYSCIVCKKNYNNWEKLVLHKYFKHKNYLPYKCVICNEAFKLHGFLNQHLLKHVDYKQTMQPVSVQTSSSNSFNKVPTTNKQFQCTNCIYKTKTAEKLSHHLRVCKGPMENMTDTDSKKCNVFLKNFSSKGQLNKHLSYHNSISNLNVQISHRNVVDNPQPVNFSSNQETLNSLRIDLPNTISTPQNRFSEFKCLYCKISCKSKRTRINHIKSHHPIQALGENYLTKLPTTSCQWCDMIITKPNLIRHIKLKHPHVKPYNCPFCDMKFKFLSGKKVHILKCHATN
ncbi:Hypothetical protein CINCED_3A003868 [Cinara cedri]|nr:Hypothetical protein CINCED_3A003868 [Cinara cedri]